MGNCNTHVFFHRVPALAVASLASFAIGFNASAGLSCSFLRVLPHHEEFLEYTSKDGIQVELSSSSIGMVCDRAPLFDQTGDSMWTSSRISWFTALGIGSLATILSWMLTLFVAPTNTNWKMLSIAAAVSAVVQVPVFLLFESQPCVEHLCRMDSGCYLLIMSTLFWTTVTFLTQCLDPPLWAEELNAWRVKKNHVEEDTTAKMWLRWKRRRRWASQTDLALAYTESGSHQEDDPMEDLLEKGSYYANSNNSRLLLHMQDGKKPGDDQKSVTTFGDLDDFVKMTEEEGRVAGLLGELEYPEDEAEEEDANLVGESLVEIPIMPTTKEAMIIHSHEDSPSQYYSNPDAFPEGATNPKGGLLLDGKDVLEAENHKTCMDAGGSTKLTAGIRALTTRIRRDASRTRCGRSYSAMDDCGSESSEEDREAFYDPPTPMEVHEEELAGDSNPNNRKLLNDWNALHAAATAGILLPTSQGYHLDEEDSAEDEPEPVYYSSEDSMGVTLRSFGHQPETEDEEETLSSMSESSDDENQKKLAPDENQPRRRGRSRQRRRVYSSAHSVGSRRSLLETTIDEETDVDLKEFESSDEDTENAKKSTQEKHLEERYPLTRSKSAPGQASNVETVSEPYNFTTSSSFPRTKTNTLDEDEKSETSKELSSVVRVAMQHRVTPVTDYETSSSSSLFDGLSSSIRSPNSLFSSEEEEGGRTTRRYRSMSLPKRNLRSVHPLHTRRGKSATPLSRSHRDARVTQAGIHSPAINVISDESSSSEKSDKISSRLAREARIQRLSQEKRRRARTLDPPKIRKPPVVDQSVDAILLADPVMANHLLIDRAYGSEGTKITAEPVIAGLRSEWSVSLLDPALDAILKLRSEGVEYGPDEMSL